MLTVDAQKILHPDSWRLTPATLAHKITNGRWIPARHLLYVSSIIATEVAKGNARIIVAFPPRHGKSELISVNTPIWFFENWPDKSVILSSYGADLSTGFSRRVRDGIIENKHLLNVGIRQDVSGAALFQTTNGGAMFAAGVGGPITGRGADLLIVDDYIKNAKDASSPTIREDQYEWFVSTAYSRLEPNGSVVILATRWHMDDIIGRTINDSSEEWIYIQLPAVPYTEEELLKNPTLQPDALGRAQGEALWPWRYPIERLMNIKRVQGNYFWQSLYQQKPIPKSASGLQDGDVPIVDIAPDHRRLNIVRSWDMASSEDGGDYTAGALIAEDTHSNIVYVLEILRFQKGPAETEDIIRAIAQQDGHDVEINLEQEPGSAGKTVVSHYQRKVLRGFKTHSERATGKKHLRAQPFMAACQAGSVRQLRGPWNRAFMEELRLFPDSPNDDQVDSTSAGYNRLIEDPSLPAVWGRTASQHAKSTTGLKPSSGAHTTGATWGRRV